MKFRLGWMLQGPLTETWGLIKSFPEAVTSMLSPEEYMGLARR